MPKALHWFHFLSNLFTAFEFITYILGSLPIGKVQNLYLWRERLKRTRNIFKCVFSTRIKRLFLKWIRQVAKPVVTTKRVHVVAWTNQFQATKLPGKGFSSKGNQTTSQPVVLVNNRLWTKETLWRTKNPW